jgi:hypothetical protein
MTSWLKIDINYMGTFLAEYLMKYEKVPNKPSISMKRILRSEGDNTLIKEFIDPKEMASDLAGSLLSADPVFVSTLRDALSIYYEKHEQGTASQQRFVFVVVDWEDYEYDDIAGVYLSFDAAKAFITKFMKEKESKSPDKEKFRMIYKTDIHESWKRELDGIRIKKIEIDG